ncbi:MAG: hypothetical protein KA265_17980 [Piscinibacter sp.]|nr:hypothetical protein [Piscinibacter sp.]
MDMTADDALSLARKFREAALAAGNFLYDNWAELDPRDRDTLRSLDITLQNVATDLVTQAVGITLDEAQTSIAKLAAATDKAKTALKKINDVKAAIGIVTALIGFAAAIPTGNIASIVSAVNAVKDATSPAKPASPA